MNHTDQHEHAQPRTVFEMSTPKQEEEFKHLEAERRLSDAALAATLPKQERYQDAQGEDWIDEFARTKTPEEFRGAMSFSIGKYNRRVGKKDDILQEVRKMRDYAQRWEEYELALLNADAE